MAKMITRTITVHTYTTGKVDLATCKVLNVKNHSYPFKLNQRQERALSKEDGNPIINVTTGEQLYAMTLEDFITYAKPVIPGEVEDDEGGETE